MQVSTVKDRKTIERVSNMNPFNELLKEVNSKVPNGLLIAGGSVLKQMVYPNNSKVVDIDMYVHANHASDVLTSVKDILSDKLEGLKITSQISPPYDSSFLRKNGILMIIDFLGDYTPVNGKKFRQEVQVMITRRPPLEVVTNFDLTCSQVWFDGLNVYGTHLELTYSGKALLQKDYVDSLIHGNTYITKRINKYQLRGFSIGIESSVPYTNTSGIKPLPEEEGYESYKFINSSTEEIFIKNMMGMLLGERPLTMAQMFYMATRGYTINNFFKVFQMDKEQFVMRSIEHIRVQNNIYGILLCDLLSKYLTDEQIDDLPYIDENIKIMDETLGKESPLIPFDHDIPFTFTEAYEEIGINRLSQNMSTMSVTSDPIKDQPMSPVPPVDEERGSIIANFSHKRKADLLDLYQGRTKR